MHTDPPQAVEPGGMFLPRSTTRITLTSALVSGLCLGLPASILFWPVLLLRLLPPPLAHAFATQNTQHLLRVLHPLSVIGGALLWGLLLGRIAAYTRPWRLALAGGFGIFAGTLLTFSLIRRDLLDQFAPGMATHMAFSMLLVLCILLVTTSTAAAFGLTVQSWRLGWLLAVYGGVSAALGAIAVAGLLGWLGIRVGSGNAAMVKVSAFALLSAALSGGAAMGWVLGRHVATNSARTATLATRNAAAR